MATSLHTLFDIIAHAQDEQALRTHLMDAVGEHFDAQYWGLCLLDELSRGAEVAIQGGPYVSAFAERYGQLGRTIDPVLRYVVEHHAPVHEGLVLSPEEWKQSELYQTCCAQYDHEHVMMGPIVSGGRLMGGVYFARTREASAFSFQNLADLSGLCLHLSSRLATLRAQAKTVERSPLLAQLTPREREIAALVARGFTNAEIGTELWISQNTVKQALKRIFRKLNVSARAELAAQLGES